MRQNSSRGAMQNNSRDGGRFGNNANNRGPQNNFGPNNANNPAFKKRTQTKKKNNPLQGDRYVDYLDMKLLGRFINDQGKILPRRITGVSAYQQRRIVEAIKYARHLALMPFVALDTR